MVFYAISYIISHCMLSHWKKLLTGLQLCIGVAIFYWVGTFTSQGQTSTACQSDRSMICETLQESIFFLPQWQC